MRQGTPQCSDRPWARKQAATVDLCGVCQVGQHRQVGAYGCGADAALQWAPRIKIVYHSLGGYFTGKWEDCQRKLDYIATVPPTTTLIAERFARKHVGLVYGWVFFSHQVGAANAAWLGGVAWDSYGDYTAAFVTAGSLAFLAGVLAL